MAQGDSVGRDLDKRTRDLSRQNIQPGQGLSAQQIAQNQLQAIQNEQRNNLSQQRLQAAATAQAQQVAVQAAQIGTMDAGPAVETLKKYGLTKPKTIKTQSHEIKMAPPNITINNTTNNTTTTGPVQGREIAFKAPQQNNSTNKFKSWLQGLLLSQKEENSKRERDFDRRESVLVRSSNKMLKRIEAAGRDIATNLNPKVIGTTVGNQFRMLLMIFALNFLAKHWDKVMNVLDKIAGFVKGSLEYFGITNRQDGHPSPFYQDLLTFFGAKSDEGSLFQVFGRLGRELVDYLKMKLEHAMSLRGDAIKNIKFPEIDTGDIFKTLSSIAGYVGNILTAMMDPKKGVADSIKREVNSSMAAVKRDSDKESVEFTNEVKGVKGLNDTSYGDYAAEVRQTLTQNALTSDGALRNNTWASLSQGRDLVQAYNNAKNGDIDIARMGGGLQRLQDTAVSKGYVTLDASTINSLFGDKLNSLIQSKDITPVQMKYVQVAKTDQDYADEGADPWSGMAKGAIIGYGLNKVDGAGVMAAGAGAATGAAIGSIIPGVGTGVGAAVGGTIGYLGTTTAGQAVYQGGKAWVKKTFSDDNTLKLVPADDPRPAVALGGQEVRTFYKVNPNALNRLATLLTGDSTITEIDSGSEKFMKALENRLVKRAGNNVRSRDYNLDEGYQAIRNIEEKERFYEQKERNSAFAQSMRTVENNAKRLVNTAYQNIGSAISTVGSYITSFSSGGSNQIRNWLWGGGAPVSYREQDRAHMEALMTRVTFPIHDLNGRESQHSLTVHKYLAEDVKSIFNEIFQSTSFRINPSTTAAFNYRPTNPQKTARDGGPMLSNHAFGSAIDINWEVNPLGDKRTANTDVHFGTKAHPVVQIFYKHSWKWLGKDASSIADPMHFEFAGKPGQVGQKAADIKMGTITQEQSDAANAGYSFGTYSSPTQTFSSDSSTQMTYAAQASYVPPTTTTAVNMTAVGEGEQRGATAGSNNPGNLIKSSGGYGTGNKNGFVTYDNLEDGFADTTVLVTKYLSGQIGGKRNPTIREILNKWCPGDNANYIKNLSTWTGLGSDTPIPLTYENVYRLVGGITRQEHSSILNKNDYVKGVEKGWNDFLKKGGVADLAGQPIPEGDNPNMMSAGETLNEIGQGMQDTELFTVQSKAQEELDNKISSNVSEMLNSFQEVDNGGVKIKDGYYKNMYGSGVTAETIEASWRGDLKKMDRDMTYAPIFAKADELWGKFGKGEEGIRSELLGGARNKREFEKQFANLDASEQNQLEAIVNRYISSRQRGVKDYDNVTFGQIQHGIHKDVNIMKVFGNSTSNIKNNEEYAHLMSTGQYKKAEELITKYYNDLYDTSKAHSDTKRKQLQENRDREIKRATEMFKEGKSYLIHGDDYKQLYRDLEAAKRKLDEAKRKQSYYKNQSEAGFWLTGEDGSLDQKRAESDKVVEETEQEIERIQTQKAEYTKIDDSINTAADAAGVAPVVEEFDKKTKRGFEIRERLAQIEKERRGEGETKFTTTAEFLAAEKEWDKEKERLLKELEESEGSLKELIGEDQKELLAAHKNKIKEMYTEMGKDVTEAENTYLELAKTGKNHQEIMLEIGEKFDEETLSYLRNFGDTLLEEKKKTEEAAKQQFRQLAAQLANIDVNSVNWDDEDLQGEGMTAAQLGKKAKIKSLAAKGMPIRGIDEDEVPAGYSWNQQYMAYLPTDQKKWGIKKVIRTYRDEKTGKLMNTIYTDSYYAKKMGEAAAQSAEQIDKINSTNTLIGQGNTTLESISQQMTLIAQNTAFNVDYSKNMYNLWMTYPITPQQPTQPVVTVPYVTPS